jgi:hypothetical protein
MTKLQYPIKLQIPSPKDSELRFLCLCALVLESAVLLV